MAFEPDLVASAFPTRGSGPISGSDSICASRLSSGPTTPGTMYASLPRQKLLIRFKQRGEYSRSDVNDSPAGAEQRVGQRPITLMRTRVRRGSIGAVEGSGAFRS